MFSRKATLLVVGLGLATAVSAVAQNSLSTSVDVARVSKYVWHGLVLNPDPAVQPSVTVSHPSGLSFNFWGSMDTTDVIGHSGDLTEQDYTLGYSWTDNDGRPVTAKVTYLSFPDRGITSFMRLRASAKLRGPIAPDVTLTYDFGNTNGSCLTFGVNRDVPLGCGAKARTVNTKAELSFTSSGYSGAYFGERKAAVSDILFSAGMPIKAGKKLTLTPALTYSYILDSDLASAVKARGLDRGTLVFGVTASSGF